MEGETIIATLKALFMSIEKTLADARKMIAELDACLAHGSGTSPSIASSKN